MKHLFCVVKRIFCDCVYDINTQAEMFEKSAPLMMCCDISTKNLEKYTNCLSKLRQSN